MHNSLKSIGAAGAASFFLALPGAATAQDIGFNYGFGIASEYMSTGFELSDGVSINSYLETSFAGLYGGVFLISGEDDLLGGDLEIDYYIGYAGEIGSFFYEVSYNWYTIPDDSSLDSEEFIVSGGYGITPTLFITASYGTYTDLLEQEEFSLALDYFTDVPGLAISAKYATVESDFGFDGFEADWDYYTIGAAYTVADNITLDLTYHDADDDGQELGVTDGIAVFTVSFDF